MSSDSDSVVTLRARDLKFQMERSVQLFEAWIRTYMGEGSMQMDPVRLKALRHESAGLREQFDIVAEAAGRTAELLLDGDD